MSGPATCPACGDVDLSVHQWTVEYQRGGTPHVAHLRVWINAGHGCHTCGYVWATDAQREHNRNAMHNATTRVVAR